MIETYLTYENGTDIKSIIKGIEPQEVEQFLLENSCKAHEALLVFKTKKETLVLNFRRDNLTCKAINLKEGVITSVKPAEKLSHLMDFEGQIMDPAKFGIKNLTSIELSLK